MKLRDVSIRAARSLKQAKALLIIGYVFGLLKYALGGQLQTAAHR